MYTNQNVQGTIPTSAVDVVGIFDSNFNQLFSGAKVLQALITPETKWMEHPVETGAVITDFRIINPVHIELYFLIQAWDVKNTYQAISQAYAEGTSFTVVTRVGSFTNQVFGSIPTNENTDFYDAVQLVCKLKQVQLAQTITNSLSPLNPNDQTTVQRGEVNPMLAPASFSTESVLNSWIFP